MSRKAKPDLATSTSIPASAVEEASVSPEQGNPFRLLVSYTYEKAGKPKFDWTILNLPREVTSGSDVASVLLFIQENLTQGRPVAPLLMMPVER